MSAVIEFDWSEYLLSFPYSKKEVSRAGDCIRDHGGTRTDELDIALNVLGAWRSSHIHPLQSTYMTLKQRGQRIDSKIIVSQRLKRVPSILVKLQRQPSMQLARMQDIGGCRAVMKNIAAVYELSKKFGCEYTDYIEIPKPDGYRGLHLISKYHPGVAKHLELSGRLIEIQMRTRLQHAWATAVETVDSMLNQKIKTGGGTEQWRRFFALASSVIALKERKPTVPDTPTTLPELIEEIKAIDKAIRARDSLAGLAASVVHMTKARREIKNAGAYILTLDLDKKTISNAVYLKKDLQKATDEYLRLEKEFYGSESVQIVFVFVDKLKDLNKAYPNYYLNVSEFMQAMKDVWK